MSDILGKQCPSCGIKFVKEIEKCPICNVYLETISDTEVFDSGGFTKDGFDRNRYGHYGCNHEGKKSDAKSNRRYSIFHKFISYWPTSWLLLWEKELQIWSFAT
ncbi:MAG: hypothetical protein WCY18_00475 [Methanofastidiosum sp.]|jgi:hypothetical protein